MSTVLRQLARKGADKAAVARKVVRSPEMLADVLDGLRSANTRVRLGCASVLSLVSESNPELLERESERIIPMLDSDSSVLRWNATRILGNLACTDATGWVELVLERYLEPITGHELIAAANAIIGSAGIAAAKPHLTDRVAAELLKVESARYGTPECRNVALGHVVLAFDRFFDRLHDPAEPLALIRRLLRNSRRATREKAAEFLQQRGLQARSPGRRAGSARNSGGRSCAAARAGVPSGPVTPRAELQVVSFEGAKYRRHSAPAAGSAVKAPEAVGKEETQ